MALEAGFDLVRFGPADLDGDGARFAEWLARGRHGQMEYLARNSESIQDPQSFLKGARTTIALALDYGRAAVRLESGARIARYAAGRDYHKTLGRRLRELCRSLEADGFPADSYRMGVDAVPVLERSLAAGAGIGFLAKSTGIIHPKLGPWLLLAEVLSTADIPWDPPSPGSCGSCSACIDACPTAAIVAPFEVDARRCLSYTTIEKRGLIPYELRAAQGAWLFGCDICIEVCPYAKWGHVNSSDPDFRLHAVVETYELVGILDLSEEEYARDWTGTAMRRAGRAGLRRNAAIVLGNLGEEAAAPTLLRALADQDGSIRVSAAWALSRMGIGRNEISQCLAREDDEVLRQDLQRSLEDPGS